MLLAKVGFAVGKQSATLTSRFVLTMATRAFSVSSAKAAASGAVVARFSGFFIDKLALVASTVPDAKDGFAFGGLGAGLARLFVLELATPASTVLLAKVGLALSRLLALRADVYAKLAAPASSVFLAERASRDGARVTWLAVRVDELATPAATVTNAEIGTALGVFRAVLSSRWIYDELAVLALPSPLLSFALVRHRMPRVDVRLLVILFVLDLLRTFPLLVGDDGDGSRGRGLRRGRSRRQRHQRVGFGGCGSFWLLQPQLLIVQRPQQELLSNCKRRCKRCCVREGEELPHGEGQWIEVFTGQSNHGRPGGADGDDSTFFRFTFKGRRKSSKRTLLRTVKLTDNL